MQTIKQQIALLSPQELGVSYQLNFEQFTNYDVGQPGITLPVMLSLVGYSARVEAKLDTGATDCVFARELGEQIGLHVESGRPVRIRTATRTPRQPAPEPEETGQRGDDGCLGGQGVQPQDRRMLAPERSHKDHVNPAPRLALERQQRWGTERSSRPFSQSAHTLHRIVLTASQPSPTLCGNPKWLDLAPMLHRVLLCN